MKESVLKKILIIDDDQLVHTFFKQIFKNEYEVFSVISGYEALEILKSTKFDFCVIDLKLSDIFGIDLFRKIKEANTQDSCVFIILTALESVDVEIQGHELGISEYMRKPIVPRLIKAIFNKYSITPLKKEVVSVGKLRIDLNLMKAFYQDDVIQLTNSEFRILHLLVTNIGSVYSRQELYDMINAKSTGPVDRSIDMHVSSLRKKIKDAGNFIKTKRGRGYFLEAH